MTTLKITFLINSGNRVNVNLFADLVTDAPGYQEIYPALFWKKSFFDSNNGGRRPLFMSWDATANKNKFWSSIDLRSTTPGTFTTLSLTRLKWPHRITLVGEGGSFNIQGRQTVYYVGEAGMRAPCGIGGARLDVCPWQTSGCRQARIDDNGNYYTHGDGNRNCSSLTAEPNQTYTCTNGGNNGQFSNDPQNVVKSCVFDLRDYTIYQIDGVTNGTWEGQEEFRVGFIRNPDPKLPPLNLGTPLY